MHLVAAVGIYGQRLPHIHAFTAESIHDIEPTIQPARLSTSPHTACSAAHAIVSASGVNACGVLTRLILRVSMVQSVQLVRVLESS